MQPRDVSRREILRTTVGGATAAPLPVQPAFGESAVPKRAATDLCKKPEDRERSFFFAMNCEFVEAIVVGVRSTAEIDEALVRMNGALVS